VPPYKEAEFGKFLGFQNQKGAGAKKRKKEEEMLHFIGLEKGEVFELSDRGPKLQLIAKFFGDVPEDAKKFYSLTDAINQGKRQGKVREELRQVVYSQDLKNLVFYIGIPIT